MCDKIHPSERHRAVKYHKLQNLRKSKTTVFSKQFSQACNQFSQTTQNSQPKCFLPIAIFSIQLNFKYCRNDELPKVLRYLYVKLNEIKFKFFR